MSFGSQRILDPEVRVLASIASTLEPDYVDDDQAWNGSPFAWIKTRPSRQVGKIGEQLVAGWSAAKGLNVVRSPDSQADRIIEGRRTEIKFSTLWKAGGYKFQQLRDQNYEIVICLGVSPFDAHGWVIPKHVIAQHVLGVTPQHGGAAGSDTAWISVKPGEEPDWLRPWGGSLGAMHRKLVELCSPGS